MKIALKNISLLIAISSLLLSGCHEPPTVVTADPIRPIKIHRVVAKTDIRNVRLPAVIDASNSTELAFQVGGKLESLEVTEGQEVAVGTVIGRLDPRNFQNSVQQAQAQFTSANKEYQRAIRLLEQNAISRSVVDQRKAARDVARAALDSAQKALDDSVLKTPFDGRIASVTVDQFESISPLQPIVTLQTVGAAEAVVQVPSTLVANRNKFTPLETYVTLDSVSDLRIPAEFLSLSTQANSATQTFTVRFKFSPPSDINILPGMSGSINGTFLVSPDDKGVNAQLSIPIHSVLSEGNDKFVWVVDSETMTVSKREITLESGIGENLYVESGLEAGEWIAGAGASYLVEGKQVRDFQN